ncbi:hemerythrin domain-containing protein [Neptuniibacter sp. CAU 1671]|uniref:hemerythrin domain-containing protein n=1 Tax=Neptuniibacter sp. CAU 1671 TaxID=3032593 RepID=UPI0023DB01BB|nr:hemerythrin domain-containing protein [Neptuniibacter sp. CAU 1671]MDF2182748.1 hemerythrin domain-containing protein [Neptuniibacter sp. CAU 1671]
MTILQELHQDHINLSRLLNLLEHEVANLQQGEAADLNLLADVIRYISEYADGYHHPREDELYAFFAGRNAKLDQELGCCVDEHHGLTQHTRILRQTLDDVLNDAVVPMTQLVEQLVLFLEEQKAHLDHEEGQLFPMIRLIAEAEDWALLAEELPNRQDPLFGAQLAAEYSALYQALLEDLQKAS